MKKIINNRVYDTDTAKLIWMRKYDGSPRDFEYFEEGLYLKRNGEYFLGGWGNGLSHYGKAVRHNEWQPGERITPLPYERARKWAEENMEADDYMKEFSVSEDDEELVALSVQVPEWMNNRIDVLRSQLGKSKQAIVTEALEKYLN